MKDKINGRTPEEIKKGLECALANRCDWRDCPYSNPDDEFCGCINKNRIDTLDYIQQLERERDAAVDHIARECRTCAHFNMDNPKRMHCELYDGCRVSCDWQWRGVQEVE